MNQKDINIAAIKHNASLPNPTYKLFGQHTDVGVGQLSLTKPVHIREGCEFDLTGNITIGQHTEISKYVHFFTHKHNWRESRGLRKDNQHIEAVDLVIGNDVFIGESALIITVRNIGNGAVIGAGSVLTKDVPAYEIWAGNPAVKIGERIGE
jgi:acetyltransferase-like isoleucine patch superfamily enzyme